MKIELSKINGEHTLNCPNCQAPRLSLTASTIQVPGGGTWLQDGDTIQGLFHKLVAEGLEPELDQDDPEAHFKMNTDEVLMVGSCPSCENDYFIVEAKFFDKRVSVTPELSEAYFWGARQIPEPSYSLAKNASLSWVVTKHQTPIGICLEHLFGPFPMVTGSLTGSNGVSSCSGDSQYWDQAQDLLFGLWPTLQELVMRLNDEAKGA